MAAPLPLSADEAPTQPAIASIGRNSAPQPKGRPASVPGRGSGRVIRGNPNKKEEVCRAIGHDSRVNDICIKYLNYGEDRYDN